MSINKYYVDNALHAADAAQGTATGGGADHILLEDKGVLPDGTFVDYGVYIIGGTGLGQSRRITAYDDTGAGEGECKATVNANWDTNPDNTSLYEITVGSDQNNGQNEGTGSTGAFRTIDRGLNSVSVDTTLYIKAGRPYKDLAIPTLDTAGVGSQWITLEGYTSAPGDGAPGGVAKIDADSTRAHALQSTLGGVPHYYQFRHLGFINATSDGVSLSGASAMSLRSCELTNNAGAAILCGSGVIVFDCLIEGNASTCTVSMGNGCRVLKSLVRNNAPSMLTVAFAGTAGLAAFCEFVGNSAIALASSHINGMTVLNCMVDGKNVADTIGISFGQTSQYCGIVLNTILYDLDKGVVSIASEECFLGDYNLYYSNNADRQAFPVGAHDLAADPQFVDQPNGDYRLAWGSPARNAGVDAGDDGMDIGGFQARDAAGGAVIGSSVVVPQAGAM